MQGIDCALLYMPVIQLNLRPTHGSSLLSEPRYCMSQWPSEFCILYAHTQYYIFRHVIYLFILYDSIMNLSACVCTVCP